VAGETASQKKNRRRRNKKKTSAVPANPVSHDDTWGLVEDAALGRCVHATRKMEAGQLVLQERAFSWVPDFQVRTRVCHHCAGVLPEPAENERFPTCGPECKAAMDPIAELETAPFDQLENVANESACDLELLWLVVRVMLTKRDQPEQFTNVLALEDHRDKFPAQWLEAVGAGLIPLLEIINCEPEDLATAVGIACRICTNGHGIIAHGRGRIGCGLFPSASMFNHSCEPNCVFVCNGRELSIRTVRAVAAGEQLSYTYTQLYQPSASRQQELLDSRFFNCRCARCVTRAGDEMMDGYLCLNKKSCPSRKPNAGGPPSSLVMIKATSAYKCFECDTEFPAEKVEQSLSAAHAEHQASKQLMAQRAYEPACTALQAMLNGTCKAFHPYHMLSFDAHCSLATCAKLQQNTVLEVEALRSALMCDAAVLPLASCEKCSLTKRLGASLLQSIQQKGPSGNKKLQLKLKTEATEVLQLSAESHRICYGQDHLLTQQVCKMLKYAQEL